MEIIVLFAPVPALLGFIVLALAPVYLSTREVIAIGVVAGTIPAAIMTATAATCFATACEGGLIPIMTLDFREAVIDLALQLDRLSALTGSTVSVIGAAVIVYSSHYMRPSLAPDLRRFFALMNLFMASMMAMVLAADSIVFFLGWEMMGLCSFFLIAFNMVQPRSVAAGRKAFVMTRIADAALLAALLLMFLEAGSVRIDTLIEATLAAEPWKAPLVAGLMLVGALGKSAQLPFHTWLPSAMAGPTPVSALLHSATMVAAGVYLLVRFEALFAATPAIAAATAGFGALTALYGAVTAFAQSDVKRLLAYSSISQIGFMILAVGVGAPEAAMAHFVVHAAFKALLFLAAGDMTRSVGGATRVQALRAAAYWRPLAFWSFAAGAASLGGLPFVAAGWFSKEMILAEVFGAGAYGRVLFTLAVVAAIFTGAYAFRPVFVGAAPGPGPRFSLGAPQIVAPIILLACASLFGGAAVAPIVDFLGGAPHHGPTVVAYVGAAAALTGVGLAAVVTVWPRLLSPNPFGLRFATGLRMDARYQVLFVRPFRRVVGAVSAGRFGEDPIGRLPVEISRRVSAAAISVVAPDYIDRSWTVFGRILAALWARARSLQSGRLRDYALWLALGAGALLVLAAGPTWR